MKRPLFNKTKGPHLPTPSTKDNINNPGGAPIPKEYNIFTKVICMEEEETNTSSQIRPVISPKSRVTEINTSW
jgi:hypothetical protein